MPAPVQGFGAKAQSRTPTTACRGTHSLYPSPSPSPSLPLDLLARTQALARHWHAPRILTGYAWPCALCWGCLRLGNAKLRQLYVLASSRIVCLYLSVMSACHVKGPASLPPLIDSSHDTLAAWLRARAAAMLLCRASITARRLQRQVPALLIFPTVCAPSLRPAHLPPSHVAANSTLPASVPAFANTAREESDGRGGRERERREGARREREWMQRGRTWIRRTHASSCTDTASARLLTSDSLNQMLYTSTTLLERRLRYAFTQQQAGGARQWARVPTRREMSSGAGAAREQRTGMTHRRGMLCCARTFTRKRTETCTCTCTCTCA